jgi:putative transposase
LYDFRKLFIPRDGKLSKEDAWMKDIPLDTREAAAEKAIAAQKTGFTHLKLGLIKHFKLGFRSKKHNNPVFYVAKKALIEGAIFSRRLKKDKYLVSKKDREFLKESDGVFSVIREKDGRYYVCVVIKPVDKKLQYRKNIVALDPGVRTFQTSFSEKTVGEYGYNTSKKLYELYKREDRLKSILARDKNAVPSAKILKSDKRCKLKKRCALLRTKIKHIVDDLHWKTCDHLTKNYQVILLPIFNTKKMANRTNRKISKTTTRLMLGLRHYDFQQKLLYKSKQRGRNTILCKEHYTSKCCGNCGKLNQKLGSKKIFECSCGLKIDRDVHAARNILLRALSFI